MIPITKEHFLYSEREYWYTQNLNTFAESTEFSLMTEVTTYFKLVIWILLMSQWTYIMSWRQENVYKWCHKKIGTLLNCEEMYEEVLLYIVGSLKCQCKIVMNNKKAITILHIRCLFLQVLTSQIHRNRTIILLSTLQILMHGVKHFTRAQHTHTHMAETAIHFNNQTQRSPHYILNR